MSVLVRGRDNKIKRNEKVGARGKREGDGVRESERKRKEKGKKEEKEQVGVRVNGFIQTELKTARERNPSLLFCFVIVLRERINQNKFLVK